MPGVNKTFENAEQASSILAAIVPQLFFDLIARLIPGLAIIWSIYLALLCSPAINPEQLFIYISNLLPQDRFFKFCITVVACYLSSIVFYGLWSVVSDKDLHTNFLEFFIKDPANPETCNRGLNNEALNFSYRYDYIKLKAPIAGNRITKLKAEIHMSGTLTAAYIVCFLISSIGLISGTLSNMLVARVLFFFFGAIGFFVSNRYFNYCFNRSVKSYSDLLNFKMPTKCALIDKD